MHGFSLFYEPQRSQREGESLGREKASAAMEYSIEGKELASEWLPTVHFWAKSKKASQRKIEISDGFSSTLIESDVFLDEISSISLAACVSNTCKSEIEERSPKDVPPPLLLMGNNSNQDLVFIGSRKVLFEIGL